MVAYAMLLALLVGQPNEHIASTEDIGLAWSGHSVGFDMLVTADHQYITWYDQERRMMIAGRTLPDGEWVRAELPERIGWDSHNYITITADDEGLLHLAGNMHVHPLKYYRTTRPWDVTSFEAAAPMVGDLEQRVTYPSFFRGPNNQLIFTYRDGASGDASQIYNAWDQATHTWSRLMDQPLTDGEGQRNAYFVGPTLGPDGWWHMIWVWRETPDCATNHDLSYARSRDLRHWERSDGTPLALPITLATAEIVAPVPVGGGLLNGNTRLGFDQLWRPIISYHRHDDDAGNTQIFSRRLEDGVWVEYQQTDWDYRWEFSGGGTIIGEIGVGGVVLDQEARLRHNWSHRVKGGGTYYIDPETLRPIGAVARQPLVTDGLGKPEGTFEGLRTRWINRAGADGTRWALRWETLDANRDRPRPEPWPEPSILRLYEIRPGPAPQP